MHVLTTAHHSPSPQVRALLAESLSLEVAVPEEEPIASRAKAIEWWLKRASNAFLKRGTEIALRELLERAAGPPEQREAIYDLTAPAGSASSTALPPTLPRSFHEKIVQAICAVHGRPQW